MVRRRRRSSANVIKPVLQAVIGATGLACGVAIGSLIIYVSGLWNELGRVVGKPFNELTKMDLLFVGAPFAVMVGCGWLDTWWGMRLAEKLEN